MGRIETDMWIAIVPHLELQGKTSFAFCDFHLLLRQSSVSGMGAVIGHHDVDRQISLVMRDKLVPACYFKRVAGTHPIGRASHFVDDNLIPALRVDSAWFDQMRKVR